MKYSIILVFALSFLGTAFSQKACSCDPITAYVKQRDFDSIGSYKSPTLLKDSWRFSKMSAPRCKAYSAHLRAEYHLSKSHFETARKYLEKEKFILDSIQCKRSAYIENNSAYGDYYLRTGEFKFAVDAYTKALSLMKKQGNPNLQAKVLLALSAAQSKLGDEVKSRNYLLQAHPIVMHLPDGPGKVDNLLNLSTRYYYHFQVSPNNALLDSSFHAADFGLHLAKRIDYQAAFVKGYNLMEDKAYHDRNFRVALQYLDSALFYTQVNEAYFEREGIFADMSDIYLELKQYDKAYQFADSSLSYAMKLENPYKVKNALELLYNCAKLSGEYERALLVYEDLAIMRDSVKQLQSQKAYNDLEEKFHRVHKEKQEFQYKQDQKLLQQQREIGDLRKKLITVGWVIFALLGFYMFMVFRQRSIKQRQKKLEIQQRLNKARINPEFIYKAIANLKNVQANTDFSKKVTAFSKLVKQLLEGSGDDFLTLDKEIEFLKLYLEIERDQKEKSFDFHFEVDEHIDMNDVCIPTMILQPFIENTVNQGFKGLKHQGELFIQFTLLGNNELAIKIQDNGRGLKAVDSSRASGIINDRLYLLNKINKASSSYMIRERQSGGVSIEIFLPLITKAYAEKLSSEEAH